MGCLAPARAPAGALVALAALLVTAGEGRAAGPALALSWGRSFAIQGAADEGGGAFQLTGLWPVRRTWSAGVGLWADDLGEESAELHDPSTGAALGPVGGPAIFTFGAGWALEVHRTTRDSAATLRPPHGPFLLGTAGYHRASHTENGSIIRRQDTFGFGLSGGWRLAVGRRAGIGVVVRYSRVFADPLLGRYVSAGLELTWR